MLSIIWGDGISHEMGKWNYLSWLFVQHLPFLLPESNTYLLPTWISPFLSSIWLWLFIVEWIIYLGANCISHRMFDYTRNTTAMCDQLTEYCFLEGCQKHPLRVQTDSWSIRYWSSIRGNRDVWFLRWKEWHCIIYSIHTCTHIT